MLYEFECSNPECNNKKVIEVPLSMCELLLIVCDNPKCENHNKRMNRVLSITPKHSSWGEW